MSYKRKLRCIGEEIILGGTSYRLESVEGCGASAVVYRASYQDELSRGAFHYVFIKELYPWTADGSIFRTGSGEISYTPDGESRMELDRERFLLGNRVNLELLRQLPSGVSGNINSFEAFGTYYSVLAVHGGENLKTLLTDGHREFTLRESAVVIKQILNALELFHKNHLLHLDISPDNILLLPEQVLLIDYNSVWDARDLRPEEFSFSEKRGYSAPEISLKHVTEIGRAADIYSVCAVFFHMVMRRPLQEQEIIGNGLRRCFTRDLDAFRNVPESAAGKAVQILRKGLHTIPRKRWSSAAALREEIDELIRRIDGKGVSRSALWETSRRACGRMPGGKDSYLRQEIRLLDGEEIFPVQTECGNQGGFTVIPGEREISLNSSESGNPLPGTDSIEQLRSRLAAGEQILLTGPGGMGKTSLLYQIWRQETSSWRPREPVTLYVPLKDYQNCAGEPFFIRKTILRGLVFSEEQNGYQDAMHELDRVLGGDPGGGTGVILLLDGLNEAGERRENLLREIEGLGSGSGCGILLTDRTDEAKAYALHAFQRAVLLPLDPETVREQLERSGCLFPEAEELLRLLTNPMLLGLYQSVCAIRREIRETGDGPSGIHSAEELIGMFFTYLCKKQLRLDSGDFAKQLCHRYLLEHLLPAVAGEMKRRRRTLLTLDEICAVSAESYRNLRRGEFGRCFPEYLGKSRLMLEGISTEEEWFDFAVVEQLTEKLGLLTRHEKHFYGLAHDNFLEYLTEAADKNRKILGQKRRRKYLPGVLVCAAAVILLACGRDQIAERISRTAALQDGEGTSDTAAAYTEEEQNIIDRAFTCVGMDMGTLSAQITAQRNVLETAATEDVLSGDPDRIADFQELMAYGLAQTDVYYVMQISEDVMAQLIQMDPDFPLDELTDLCGMPDEMAAVMQQAFEDLEDMLCEESARGEGDKRALVEAYNAYLDAYVQYAFYELDYVLLRMDPDHLADVLNDESYTKIFQDWFQTIGVSDQDVDLVETVLTVSGEALKDAQRKMTACGYSIDWD
ncbi:MAG: hypothetical protein LIO80_01120 [Lachnospiraceae bacterium]|nr:hypothetical protein [Lachnospiraceae bacterium]